MRQLTTIKPLQHFLENRLARHVKGLSTDHKPLKAFPVSDCCGMPLNREGSYEYCTYCGEPHIDNL